MSTVAPRSAPGGTQGTTSVGRAFELLFQELRIEQWRPIASRQQVRLRERIGSSLRLVTSYLTGSYRRHTQIYPLNDIDLLLVLDPDVYGHLLSGPFWGPSEALDLLQSVLRAAYPETEMERHNCCVRLQFAGTGIGFDIIPAFADGLDVFLIPDTDTREWVRTNPKEHQRLISEANQDVCGGMLVPLVKFAKACNEELGKPVTGFHVEMMAYYALRHRPESYAEGTAWLLNRLASMVTGPVPDPWPLGRRVDQYLTADRRVYAAHRLRGAADAAHRAVWAEQHGDTDEAHRAWREVFGADTYPVRAAAGDAKPLSAAGAIRAVTSESRISASSAGLIGLGAGYSSALTPTSHGGAAAPHRSYGWSGSPPDEAWLERQIATVRRQFTSLERMSPDEAAADPAIWPVREEHVESLYAVLVGEQRTNLGGRHRLLIVIPKDAPGVEPAIYDLRPVLPERPTPSGWRPKRNLLHRWGGGVLCTHAARDRWDGQLVTLVIWAVDWMVRQDYYQRHGAWLGPQIDRHGRLVINGKLADSDPRLWRGGSRGRRVRL